MRVNPNSDLVGITRTSTQVRAGDPQLGADKLSITTVDTLNRALEQTPATRAEKVAEAMTLVADTTYPPTVLIRKISALLAIKMAADSGPDQATSD